MFRFIKLKWVVTMVVVLAALGYGLISILGVSEVIVDPSEAAVTEVVEIYIPPVNFICHYDPASSHLLVNVRQAPLGKILTGWKEGHQIEILSAEGAWSYVQSLTTKEEGYVHNNFICP